jgi:hypothetical protein
MGNVGERLGGTFWWLTEASFLPCLIWFEIGDERVIGGICGLQKGGIGGVGDLETAGLCLATTIQYLTAHEVRQRV